MRVVVVLDLARPRRWKDFVEYSGPLDAKSKSESLQFRGARDQTVIIIIGQK